MRFFRDPSRYSRMEKEPVQILYLFNFLRTVPTASGIPNHNGSDGNTRRYLP
jgi:hypothetical protein